MSQMSQMGQMDRIQDQVLTSLILESLFQKGKVTIEEAQFFKVVADKVLEESFSMVLDEVGNSAEVQETTEQDSGIESVEENSTQSVEATEATESAESAESAELEESETIVSKLLKIK